MAEVRGQTNYTHCSQCKCKYHNRYDDLKDDFGYSRLGERYKTCVKCRERRAKKRDKQLNQEVGEQYQCCVGCYKIKL